MSKTRGVTQAAYYQAFAGVANYTGNAVFSVGPGGIFTVDEGANWGQSGSTPITSGQTLKGFVTGGLETLNLSTRQYTYDVAQFASAANLTTLRLTNSGGVGDLNFVSDFLSLEDLRFDGTAIALDLASLSNLAALTSFNGGSGVTGNLSAFENKTLIQRLTIEDSSSAEGDLTSLLSSKNTMLFLTLPYQAGVSGNIVCSTAVLTQFVNARLINLINRPTTTGAVNDFSVCTQLTDLRISSTGFTGGFDQLISLTNVRDLRLDGLNMSQIELDAGLQAFANNVSNFTQTNKTLRIDSQQTGETPSAAGNTAIATLQANGWTVIF